MKIEIADGLHQKSRVSEALERIFRRHFGHRHRPFRQHGGFGRGGRRDTGHLLADEDAQRHVLRLGGTGVLDFAEPH